MHEKEELIRELERKIAEKESYPNFSQMLKISKKGPLERQRST
jgi:hypothetical protein